MWPNPCVPWPVSLFYRSRIVHPTCDPALARLAIQSDWCKSPEEQARIQHARDAIRVERRSVTHRFAAVRWYKPAGKLLSKPGTLKAAPVILTGPDLIKDVWWRDRFHDEDSKFVPLSAIIGGYGVHVCFVCVF